MQAGRGGFEPSVMAHELVHTVQQDAVQGSDSASMPQGAVQLLPDDEEDELKAKEGEKFNDNQKSGWQKFLGFFCF